MRVEHMTLTDDDGPGSLILTISGPGPHGRDAYSFWLDKEQLHVLYKLVTGGLRWLQEEEDAFKVQMQIEDQITEYKLNNG